MSCRITSRRAGWTFASGRFIPWRATGAAMRFALFLTVAIMLLGFPAAALAGEGKSERDARMQWWREARFGLFVHFGLYSIPAGQWNNKKVAGAAEWIMNEAHVPLADYAKL